VSAAKQGRWEKRDRLRPVPLPFRSGQKRIEVWLEAPHSNPFFAVKPPVPKNLAIPSFQRSRSKSRHVVEFPGFDTLNRGDISSVSPKLVSAGFFVGSALVFSELRIGQLSENLVFCMICAKAVVQKNPCFQRFESKPTKEFARIEKVP
jgi:hypothetical protein